MVDQVLKGLFGGQEEEDDDRRRARARDFVNRYEQGPPSEGYGNDEVLRNYRAVTDRLSPEQYQEAAAESFSRLSKEERRQMRRAMKKKTGGRIDAASDDPRDLAKAASRFQQEESASGGLASLFDFGGGGDDDQKRGGLVDAKRDEGGDLLDNPLAKAALAGVAAFAVKKFLDSR
jgi:hypothetical protein